VSYDLHVWTALRPELGTLLSPDASWRREAQAFCLPGKGWQVSVTDPDQVEAEDVPDDVAGSLPGIRFLTGITVEPIDAPKSAFAAARKAAKAIAKQAHGAIHDPQEDSVVTLAGLKRYLPQARPERFAAIGMSWWFVTGPLSAPHGLEHLVDLLEELLPEALPRRYGLFEPPQHRLADEGMAHFRKFLELNRSEIVVWYPSRPVLDVVVEVMEAATTPRSSFRCSRIEVAVEKAALAQPGWQAGLQTFWRRASTLVRPFYGEVRTIGGLIRGGATHASDISTEFGPTCNSFWRGIPRDPGHACVLGPEYLAAWPAFRARCATVDDLGFLSSERWGEPTTVVDLVGPVPDEIAQRHTPRWTEHPSGGLRVNWNREYPAVWPFGERPPPDPEW